MTTINDPSQSEAHDALKRIRSKIRRTPLIVADEGLFPVSRPLIKLEQMQVTGSFKARGALNSCHELGEQRNQGLVTASGGNHGQAVAWAAQILGAPATIFVPEDTPAPKLNGIRRYSSDLRIGGKAFADAAERATNYASDMDAHYIHAYDHPAVIAGQATVGLELKEQLIEWDEQADTILVAIGGGGLASGISLALEGQVRVVGVESESCPTWRYALEAGCPVDAPNGGIASDALGATRLGDIAYRLLTRTGAGSVLVPDEAIASTQKLLWETYRLVIEPGGATAAAALLSGAYQPEPGERVVVLVCGSNADPVYLPTT